jgi:DNA-directed RNA polymerase subunit RPC12/RpoP
MATKIQEAINRMFKNVFVCQKCKSKMRADSQRVLKGKVKCRKCGGKQFRPLKKK